MIGYFFAVLSWIIVGGTSYLVLTGKKPNISYRGALMIVASIAWLITYYCY